jgi:O-antigen ligase
VSTVVNGVGNPWPALTTIAGSVIAFAAGRLLSRVIQVPAYLLASALVAIALLPPLAPPLAYANADAALYVQSAALAGIAACATTGSRPRTLGAVLAGCLVVVTAVMGSLAGFVTGLAVLAALLLSLADRRPPRRLLLAGLVGLVLSAHLVVLVLGATHRPHGTGSVVKDAAAASLSERRLALWDDAVGLAAEHPLAGIGPRQFPVTSPTAQADPDTRETHSATLQMAAETGWPGAAALLGLLLWSTARPLLGPAGNTGRAFVTATAATALAVHAAVDYVLGFPVVVATAAFVLGAGTDSGPQPSSTDPVPANRR